MAKRNWKEVIANLEAAFRSGDYVYIYGAKNVRLKTENQIRQFFTQEPAYFARYSEAEKQQIIRNSIGHMADDCSGLTGWVGTGDRQWSWGQIQNCYKYNSLAAGPTASVLFTTFGGQGRHAGIDAGNGWCYHIGAESTDANIRAGKAGILFEPIGNRPWERSGQSNAVDYAGVYSPYEPTTQLIDEITHPTHETGTVITDLYLRTGPGVQNQAVLVMPAGATVAIYDYAKASDGGTWAFVDYKGTTGWCNKSYLKII